MTDERRDILQHALIGYQAQYDEIERKIADVRRRLGRFAQANGTREATPLVAKPAKKKHRISAEGRARIAAAQRERWRKAHAAGRKRLR